MVKIIKSFKWSPKTQWEMVSGLAGGGLVRMVYSDVEAVFRIHGLSREKQIEIFEDLQVMERAALQVQNEKARRS